MQFYLDRLAQKEGRGAIGMPFRYRVHGAQKHVPGQLSTQPGGQAHIQVLGQASPLFLFSRCLQSAVHCDLLVLRGDRVVC